MAVELSVPSSRFEGKRLQPQHINFNPEDNGRAFPYTLADLSDLLSDLEGGTPLKQPLLVKKRWADKSVWLVAGYRRLAAGLEYAKTHPDFTLPVIFDNPKDELEQLITNIRENVARKTLTHIDLGHDAARLQAAGKKVGEIANILEVSAAQVTQHIKLVTELGEREQKLVHEGKLSADDAFALLKVPAENRSAATTSIIEQLEPSSRVDSVEGSEGPTESGKSASAAVRAIARESGAVLTVRLPEFKKYLKEAIEEEGPGSIKGEVELKKSLLEFLEGKLTQKQLDNRFAKFCKEKV